MGALNSFYWSLIPKLEYQYLLASPSEVTKHTEKKPLYINKGNILPIEFSKGWAIIYCIILLRLHTEHLPSAGHWGNCWTWIIAFSPNQGGKYNNYSQCTDKGTKPQEVRLPVTQLRETKFTSRPDSEHSILSAT